MVRRGGDVDVVDADSGAPNDLEPLGGFDHLGGDFGTGADDEGVEPWDGSRELGLLEARLVNDFDAGGVFQDGEPRLAERVGNENA